MSSFNAYRRTQAAQLEFFARSLKVAEIIDPVFPAFVGNRYRVESIYEDPGYGGNRGRYTVVLQPDLDKMPRGKADSLHADVDKLYTYLVGKRNSDGNGDCLIEPTRSAQSWGGKDGEGAIKYRMVVSHIPELGGKHLEVNINGIPEGSKCKLVRTPKGEPRQIQDYTVELVCED